VIPEGLLRLAALTEETAWIHRAWALQEVLAPPSVMCLFSWILGDASLQATTFARIEEAEPQKAAIAPLQKTLEISLKFPRIKPKPIDHPESIVVKILGDRKHGAAHVMALIGALHNDGRVCIWRSAYLRTSSRPVDMVFSIMGLLGVSLKPSMFERDDRQHATIALIQIPLHRGELASWLGMLPGLGISRFISTPPVMPRTSVDGKAYIKTSEGYKEAVIIARGDISLISNMPKGSMDENGYFTFRGKAMSIRKAQSKRFNRFSEPDVGLLPFVPGPAKTITQTESSRLSLEIPGKPSQYWTGLHISLMLVDEHAADRFHNIVYAKVEGEATAGWVTQQLTAGGPLALESDGIARKRPFLQTSVDSAING